MDTIKCSCGLELEISPDVRGKQARCGRCGAVIDVPSEPDLPVLGEASPRKAQLDAHELYETVLGTIVGIKSEHGRGSGVVVDARGIVVTNRHVIGLAAAVEVRLSDSSTVSGTVIRSFPEVDLAFIKVDWPTDKSSHLARSSTPKIGQKVYAIGHPHGLENTLTQGVISSLERELNGVKYLQMDAPINPGNSGGPLFDEFGSVIGINTLVSGIGTGLGFALPSTVVWDRLARIGDAMEQLETARYCGVCGRRSRDHDFCGHCGNDLKAVSGEQKEQKPDDAPAASVMSENTDSPRDTCPACKARAEPGTDYCPRCGSPLK